MPRFVLFAAIFLAIVSCQSPGGFGKGERQAVADTVRQTLYNYYDDIASSGLMAELNWLDSSPEFFWVPPGYHEAISYDSVASFTRRNAPLFKKIHNVWDSLRVIPLTPGLASYTGRLHSIMTDTSGKTSTYFLIETGMVIKRKDGWKLLNGQTAIMPGQ